MMLFNALGCYCLGTMLLMASLILHQWPRAWRIWDRAAPVRMQGDGWLLFFVSALILAAPVMLPRCIVLVLMERFSRRESR